MIGNPVDIGTVAAATGLTSVITTTKAIPKGALVIVVGAALSTATLSSVSDGTNSYTVLDAGTGANCVAVAYMENAAAVASGASITLTWSNGTGNKTALAFYVTGMILSGSADANSADTTGTAASATSVATGVLAQAYELIVGVMGGSGTISAFVPGSGYTAANGVVATVPVQAAWQIVNATTTVAWAPSWTTSTTYHTRVLSFKGVGLLQQNFDQPNPVVANDRWGRSVRAPLETRPSLLVTTLKSADQFYGTAGEPLRDWPNPTLRLDRWGPAARAERETPRSLLVTTLKSADTFYGVAGNPLEDWPNPTLKVDRYGWAARSQAEVWQDRLLTTLRSADKFFGVAGNPVTDWPNPTLSKDRRQDLLGFAYPSWPLFVPGPPPIGPVPSRLALGTLTALMIVETAQAQRIASASLVINETSPQASPFSLQYWPNPIPPPPRMREAPGSETGLLQTTLGAVVAPFGLDDWPNPRGPLFPVDGRTLTASLLPELVGKDVFFGGAGQAPANMDWPVPRGPAYPVSLRTATDGPKLVLAGADQFYGLAGSPTFDWPVPRGYVPGISLRTWTDPLKVALQGQDQMFGAPGQVPTRNVENPVLKAPNLELRTLAGPVALNLLGKDSFFGLAGAPTFDWPVPRGPAPLHRSWSDAFKLSLLGQDQFFGAPGEVRPFDWPNPLVARRLADAGSLLPNLLASGLGVVALPFSLDDWPVPRGPIPSIVLRTWLDPLKVALQGQDAFFGLAGAPTFDWPLPRGPVPGVALRTWLDSFKLPLAGQDQFFGAAGQGPANLDWPVPRGPVPAISLRTWTDPVKLSLLGQDQFFGAPGQTRVFDWPNPNPSLDRRGVRTQNEQFGFNYDLFTLYLPTSPFEIGSTAGSSITSVVIPIKAAVPQSAGILLVCMSAVANTDLASVSDPINGAYQTLVETPTDLNGISYAYFPLSAALAAGTNITVNWNGVAGRHAVTAICVPGMAPNPIDATPARTTGTATSATPITSGPLAQQLELLLGTVTFAGNNPGAFSANGSFGIFTQTPSGCFSDTAWQTSNDNTLASKTFGPSWSNSVAYGARFITVRLISQFQAFLQSEWPVPRGPGYAISLRTWADPLKLALQGQDQFFGAAGQGPAYDWPNPLPPRRGRDDLPGPNLLGTVLGALAPFALYDWPVPAGYKLAVALRTHLDPLKVTLQGQDSFFGLAGSPEFDWPNPGIPRRLSDAGLLLPNLLTGSLGFNPAPFALYDWPVPRGYLPGVALRTWADPLKLALQGKDQFYGLAGSPLFDWPNPRGSAFPSDLRTFIEATPLGLPGTDAFFGLAGHPVFDWPVPRGYTPATALKTWTDGLKLGLAGTDRFFGLAGSPTFDWPVPKGPVPGISLRTWTDGFKLSLIGQDQFFGAPGQAPALLDWPVPRGATPGIALRTWLDPLKLNLLGQDVFFRGPGQAPNYDWTNPLVARRLSDAGVLLPSLLVGTLAPARLPFGISDWPVPRGATPGISLRTWLEPVKLPLLGKDKFFGLAGSPTFDWPVPKGYPFPLELRWLFGPPRPKGFPLFTTADFLARTKNYRYVAALPSEPSLAQRVRPYFATLKPAPSTAALKGLAYIVEGDPMPAAIKDFPAIDAVIGKQTLTFDFGNFLPTGTTLTGTPTITISVALGTDATPAARLSGPATVGTAPAAQGGSGVTNAAILQQVAGCLGGVTYLIVASCARSDGTDIAVMSAHLPSVVPA